KRVQLRAKSGDPFFVYFLTLTGVRTARAEKLVVCCRYRRLREAVSSLLRCLTRNSWHQCCHPSRARYSPLCCPAYYLYELVYFPLRRFLLVRCATRGHHLFELTLGIHLRESR